MDPVARVWVVLHRVGPDGAGPLDSLQSDAAGRYSFTYARTGSDEAVYFVSASHNGIAYFTPPLHEHEVKGEEAEITVFDTTSKRVPISVRGHHVVVSAVDGRAERLITEVFELSNDSSVTRVAASEDAAGATWATVMTAGGRDFTVSEGDFPSAAVKFGDGKVALLAPIAPGIKQVSFSYKIPASAFPISLPITELTGVYEVLIEEKTGGVSAPQVKEVEAVTVDQRSFRRFLGSDVPRNSIAVITLPAPKRAVHPGYLVGLTLVLGGAMIFALARALKRG